jgi:hypothetical protein
MNYPVSRARELRGRRPSRIRRAARSVTQVGRRRFGRGGVQGENVGDIAREAGRAARGRLGGLFRRRR